ncbi:LOW QUALITY PROTEIN: myb-like protein X [Vespula maculifrons]|uniref:Myb-like protein X n=1 Tax=Vespula maculifrons TaxID=7453 RepID=A0ABD2CLY5_VESMC
MFNYHIERRIPCIFFERNYNSDIGQLGSSAILLGSWNCFHLRLVLLRVDVQLFIEIVQSSKHLLTYYSFKNYRKDDFCKRVPSANRHLSLSTFFKIFLMFLGNNKNHHAENNSKAFPFEINTVTLTYPCSILNRKKNRKTKLIMVTTKNFLEIEIVLFHYATLEWWYEAREYTPFKGSKAASVRGYNRLSPERSFEGISNGSCGSWVKKEDFFAESFLITSCSTLRRIQSSRKGKMEINSNVNSVLGYRTNVESYIYRNNIYFNAMSEIRAGKENIKAINNYSKKDLRIHVKDEEEEKGDTGDEEVEGFTFGMIKPVDVQKIYRFVPSLRHLVMSNIVISTNLFTA